LFSIVFYTATSGLTAAVEGELAGRDASQWSFVYAASTVSRNVPLSNIWSFTTPFWAPGFSHL